MWVDQILEYEPYYEKWIKTRFGGDYAVANHLHDCHVAEGKFLDECFIKYIPLSVSYVMNGLGVDQKHEKLVQLVKVSEIELCKQLCSMLDAFLPHKIGARLNYQDVEAICVYCILWSFRAHLDQQSRIKFDFFHEVIIPRSTPRPKQPLFSILQFRREQVEVLGQSNTMI